MKSWIVLLVLGIFMILGGIFALLNPFAASLAVTTMVGAVFLIGGALQLWSVFSDASQPHRLWNGFIGVLGLLAGVSLLANPLAGMVSLVTLLGITFILTGLARLAMAFALRATPAFWIILISGAASVLLGVLVFVYFPEAASTLLGYLLGFELVSEGAGLIALGVAYRNRADQG